MDGKSKTIVHYLNQDQIDFLRCHFVSHTFSQSVELFYEGQTPNVGFFLESGGMVLCRQQRVWGEVQIGGIIGLREVLTNELSKFTVFLKGGSKVIVLDKTTLLTFFSKPEDFLLHFSKIH